MVGERGRLSCSPFELHLAATLQPLGSGFLPVQIFIHCRGSGPGSGFFLGFHICSGLDFLLSSFEVLLFAALSGYSHLCTVSSPQLSPRLSRSEVGGYCRWPARCATKQHVPCSILQSCSVLSRCAEKNSVRERQRGRFDVSLFLPYILP